MEGEGRQQGEARKEDRLPNFCMDVKLLLGMSKSDRHGVVENYKILKNKENVCFQIKANVNVFAV